MKDKGVTCPYTCAFRYMYYEIVPKGTDKRTKGHAKDVGTQIQMSGDDVQERLSQTDETRRSTTRRRKIHDV